MRSGLLLLTLLVLTSCSGNARRAGAPSDGAASARDGGASAPAPAPVSGSSAPPAAASTILAPPDAWAAIAAGALLVDVRTPSEYEQGHLENALLIPHDQIAARASELGDDKSRAIVLYCRTGNRSNQAKKALEGLGFTNVMNAGGYETLKQHE